MAKETPLKKEKDLGKVTKKLANGMYATAKGGVIPPYPGIAIGDAVKIDKDGKFVFPEKEQPRAAVDEQVSRAEFEALKKQNEELAKLLGEKGGDVKVVKGGEKGGGDA